MTSFSGFGAIPRHRKHLPKRWVRQRVAKEMTANHNSSSEVVNQKCRLLLGYYTDTYYCCALLHLGFMLL